MGRKSVWPPRVCFHKSSGQDRIIVNGKSYYLGKAGSQEAKAEYARLVTELARQGQAGPASVREVGPGFLVCEVLAKWWEYARRTYSKRGRELDQFRLALEPLERLYATLPAARFGREQLRELQRVMLDGSWWTDKDREHGRRKHIEGLARGVVNRRIGKIRTVWRWLEDEAGMVPAGSWAGLSVVKPVRRGRPDARKTDARRSTTLDEVKAVGRHANPVVRAMLLLQWWTGMRSGEVRIMRVADVDTSGDVWVYRPREHKTDYLGHIRVVVLGSRARAVLSPWLALARPHGPDAFVFAPRGRWRPSAKARRPDHEPTVDWSACYTRDGFCQAVRAAADRAGCPRFVAYLNRHSTRMRVSQVGGDEAARAVLGQRHLDTTIRYGEIDLGLARDVQKRIG